MSNLVQKIECRARRDLQSSFVRIFYEISNTVQGEPRLQLAQDFYPNPLPSGPRPQFSALQFTVNLQGASVNILSADLVCDPITPDDTAWWLRKHPKYKPWDSTDPADANNPVSSFAIDPESVQRAPIFSNPAAPAVDKGYANESRSTAIPTWTTFKTQRITVSVNATVTYRNGQKPIVVPLAFQCTSTNARSGNVRTQEVTQSAEPIPVGLAKDIYDAISVLQYEGEIVLQEEEVSGQLLIGDLFNLTGSANNEWVTMQAQVQEVVENLDTGQTTIRFGPPKTLGAGELVDLLRVNRFRFIGFPFTGAINGTPGSGGDLDITSDTPEKNSSHNEGPAKTQVVSSTVDGTGSTITHTSDGSNCSSIWATNADPSAGSVNITLSDCQGSNLRIRTIKLCQDGVSGTQKFICGEFIPDP